MRKVYSLKSTIYSIFLTLVTIHYTLCTCLAQSVSSTELIENANFYDGKVISYTGEVVGDVMARGRFAWVNLNDGKHAIGIWIDKELTRDIRYTAGYKSKGDWFEVTGIFHKACLQHGGDLDIHAQAIRKIKSGMDVIEQVDVNKKRLLIGLSVVLCLVLILRQLKRISL